MRIILKEIMISRKLTYRQVENMTDVPKSTIQKIASEKVCPNMEVMEKLAKGLGVAINELFESSYK